MTEGYAGDRSPADTYAALKNEPGAVLVDVRTVPEWQFVGVPDLAPVSKEPLFVEWHKSMSAIIYFKKHFCSGRSCFLLGIINISVVIRFLLLVVPLTIVWLWCRIMLASTGGQPGSDRSA